MKLHLSKSRLIAGLLFLFWYISLFPGRLGYDYVLLSKMIREGSGTALWGASYFWFFKVLTFNAQTIALISLVGLLILSHAVIYFVQSLPINKSVQIKAILFMFATPIIGVFGVTVSHDVLQTSGIILLTSLFLRRIELSKLTNSDYWIAILASCYLTTTQLGLLILAISLFMFSLSRLIRLREVLLLIVFSVALSTLSNIGIPEGGRLSTLASDMVPKLLLADLKCIAQHPEAEITPEEWTVLETYSPRETWRNQVTCSSSDELIASLALPEGGLEINSRLLKTFLRVTTRQPSIPLMSHVQRSRVALPPPFFQPPTNQIPWDISIPLGFGTNTSLQTGPGFLHPSIDDPLLDKRIDNFRPLEALALLPAFFMNQASWLWTWGGLWFWFILYFLWRWVRLKGKFNTLLVLTPTFTLHLLLYFISPVSLGRYVMSTIIMGVISFSISLYLYSQQNFSSFDKTRF